MGRLVIASRQLKLPVSQFLRYLKDSGFPAPVLFT